MIIDFKDHLDFSIEDNGIGICTILDMPLQDGYIHANFFYALKKLVEHVSKQPVHLLIIDFQNGTNFVKGLSPDLWEMFSRQGLKKNKYKEILSTFLSLQKLPIPSISYIRGPCVGPSLELALHTTYRFTSACEETFFQFPELNLHLLPLFGSTNWFYNKFGSSFLQKLLTLKKPVKAEEAYQMGLVNGLIPLEASMRIMKEMAQEIIHSGSLKKEPVSLSTALRNKLRIMNTKAFSYDYYKPALKVLKKKYVKRFYIAHTKAAIRFIQTPEFQNRQAYYQNTMNAKLAFQENTKDFKFFSLKVGIIGFSPQIISLAINILSKGHFLRIFERRADKRKEAERFIYNHLAEHQKLSSLYRFQCPSKNEFLNGMDVVLVSNWDDELIQNINSKYVAIIDNSEDFKEDFAPLSFNSDNSDVSSSIVHIYERKLSFQVALLTTEDKGILEGSNNFMVRFLLSVGYVPFVQPYKFPTIIQRLAYIFVNESFHLLDMGFSPEYVDDRCKKYGFNMGPFQFILQQFSYKKLGSLMDKCREYHEYLQPYPLLIDYLKKDFYFTSQNKLSKVRTWLTLRSNNKSITGSLSGNVNEGNFTRPLVYERYCGRIIENALKNKDLDPVEWLLATLVNEAKLCLKEMKTLTSEVIDIISVNHLGFPVNKAGLLHFYDTTHPFNYKKVILKVHNHCQ